MTRLSRSAAILLWSCIALFAARVIGQFEVMLLAPAWLPPMDAWYSGLMPYYLLLPAQVVLLMIMTVVAWNRRVRTGRFAAANPRAARALRFAAYVYLGLMARTSRSQCVREWRASSGGKARSRWRFTGCWRCSCW